MIMYSRSQRCQQYLYTRVVGKVLSLIKKTSSKTDRFYTIFHHSPPELQCTLTTDIQALRSLLGRSMHSEPQDTLQQHM